MRSLVPNERNSRSCGELAGEERRARYFDHHAELVVEVRALLAQHRGGDGVDEGLDEVDLALGRDQRDHHLGMHRSSRRG